MVLLDVSYMRGSPLHYSSTSTTTIPVHQPLQPSYHHQQHHQYYENNNNNNRYSYFNRFDLNSKDNMAHELIMPQSPTSSQSDSENSVSSIEISPKQIRPTIIIKSTSEVECRWRNCGLRFESLDLLASHVTKVHAASGPGGLFYCGWEGCTRNNRGFNARYKMLVHVRTHTNEKPHRCDQCDKSFSRAENLKIHTRSHSGEKPYVCPVPGCLKAYSNSSDRFKHTRTHQIDKPYQCKIPGCPKRYTDPSSLRKHVKTFKHFVAEEYASENVPKTGAGALEDLAPSVQDKYYVPQEIPDVNVVVEGKSKACSCNCPHKCCSGASRDVVLNGFRGLVDLRRTEEIKQEMQWNRLFLYDQRIYNHHRHHQHQQQQQQQQESQFKVTEENMDVDVPLDLSVTKKTTIFN